MRYACANVAPFKQVDGVMKNLENLFILEKGNKDFWCWLEAHASHM